MSEIEGEHRCHLCGGLGPREVIAQPHMPVTTDEPCPGDSDPRSPIPLSELFPETPSRAEERD